jgi:hypothetical protein
MRAKPRCGHGMSFSKKQEGQVADRFSEAAGSDNLAIQQFHIPQQTSLVPATLGHAAALPAFGHPEHGWEA